MSISAHMSGDVVGWRDALSRQFADNLERWLDERPMLNVVDKDLGFSADGRPAGQEMSG